MKNLTQYRYSVENLFFQYLKGYYTLPELIKCLKHIEAIEREKDEYTNDQSMWFRIPTDSTLATTIEDIERNLSLPKSHPNHQHLIECMCLVIGINYTIDIYFS